MLFAFAEVRFLHEKNNFLLPTTPLRYCHIDKSELWCSSRRELHGCYVDLLSSRAAREYVSSDGEENKVSFFRTKLPSSLL